MFSIAARDRDPLAKPVLLAAGVAPADAAWLVQQNGVEKFRALNTERGGEILTQVREYFKSGGPILVS